MSTTPRLSETQLEVRRLGVETTGIEIIEESERTAQPRDLFWPWFAANVSVFGISYAAFVLGFGISFWQSVLVVAVGVVVSFALCGVIAIAGKRGSAPTMVLSRAAFGVTGQKAPRRHLLAHLDRLGDLPGHHCHPGDRDHLHQLGWGGGTGDKISPAWSSRPSSSLASVAGYHIIMRLQSWLTWITGVVTVAYIVLTPRTSLVARLRLQSGRSRPPSAPSSW